MQMQDFDTSHPYVSKIKALGYSLTFEKSQTFIKSLNSDESWYLKYIDERWLLCVNDVPQIAFLPEEALKFLAYRKFHIKSKRSQSLRFKSAFA